MTVTATTRFGLPRWSAGTDPLTRAQIDGAMAAIEAEGASYGQGTIAARPAASAANGGLFYVVNDATGGGILGACYYCDGAAWIYLNPRTVRIPHTFTISGTVNVPSGDTDYVPPFYVPVPAGQTVKFAKVVMRINSGTSVTFKLQKAGVDIATGYSATTSGGSSATGAGASFADNDTCALVVTAVSGTPKNMTATVYFDYTF